MTGERIECGTEGALGHIRLHAGPLNILNTDDLRALHDAVRTLDSCAVILLEAEGERAFCAGVEIADHVPDRADAMLDAFNGVVLAFREASPAIVCAVGAPALGGGFEIVLLSDLAICSTRAHFALPEVQLAALPPIACAALPRIAGERRAFDAILTGKRIDAETALAWGLVSEITAPETLRVRARAICEQLLSYSRGALVACKRALRSRSLADSMHIYRDELLPTDDAAEGIKAFLEKRPPVWTHTDNPVEVSS